VCAFFVSSARSLGPPETQFAPLDAEASSTTLPSSDVPLFPLIKTQELQERHIRRAVKAEGTGNPFADLTHQGSFESDFGFPVNNFVCGVRARPGGWGVVPVVSGV